MRSDEDIDAVLALALKGSRVFADQVLATAILDRLLHQATTINIRGNNYRLREKRKVGLFPDLAPASQEVSTQT